MNNASHYGVLTHPHRVFGLSALAAIALTVAACHAATAARNPVAANQVDDGATGWTWSGMDEFKDPDLYGGSGHAGKPGSYGAYTFSGTGVTVYGSGGSSITVDGKTHKLGKAHVTVDGALAQTGRDGDTVICRVSGLKDGNHVVEIDAAGGWLVIDYLKVQTAESPDDDVPAAGQSSIKEGDYLIMPKHAPGECLDCGDGGTGDGTKLQLFKPILGRPQVWHVTPLGDELYRVALKSSANQVLCLKVPTQADWAPRAFLWHDVGDPTQKLRLIPADSGYFRIAPSNSPQTVLDAGAQGTADGTPADSFGWWGGGCQQWALRKVTLDE